MDNVVTITNTKENILDFQIDINGVNPDDMKVRFVVETNLAEFGFVAVKEDKKWVVTIPPLPILEKTAHNFRIDVIVDGYYFEAMRGMLNVTGSVDLYTTTPKNITAVPIQTDPSQQEEPVITPNTPLIIQANESHGQSHTDVKKIKIKKHTNTDPQKTDTAHEEMINEMAQKIFNKSKKPKTKIEENKNQLSKKDIAVTAILESINDNDTDKSSSKKESFGMFKKKKIIIT